MQYHSYNRNILVTGIDGFLTKIDLPVILTFETMFDLDDQDNKDIYDIVFGEVRFAMATMKVDEIDNNHDKLLDKFMPSVEQRLKFIGCMNINLQIEKVILK